jgi:hypothetical protein
MLIISEMQSKLAKPHLKANLAYELKCTNLDPSNHKDPKKKKKTKEKLFNKFPLGIASRKVLIDCMILQACLIFIKP